LSKRTKLAPVRRTDTIRRVGPTSMCTLYMPNPTGEGRRVQGGMAKHSKLGPYGKSKPRQKPVTSRAE